MEREKKELPEEIIHQIMLLLGTKDAARASLLSKSWLHAWYSLPVLTFNQRNFGIEPSINYPFSESYLADVAEVRSKFLRFVDHTMKRYHQQNIPILKFWLSVTFVDGSLVSSVRRWVSIALGNGVRELYIETKPALSSSPLVLLHSPFLDLTKKRKRSSPLLAESLKFFHLSGCKMVHDLLNNGFKAPNLRTLILDQVHMDESSLKKLTSFCPNIANLDVVECQGISRIEIVNLRNLERFEVCPLGNEDVVVEGAPRLHSFHYRNGYNKPQCWFNIDTCGNLKHICLAARNLTNEFLTNLISKLPLIEDLRLKECDSLEKIKFSSNTLKNLSILSCRNLVEANFDAPNLISLEYYGRPSMISDMFLESIPRTCKTYLMLLICPVDLNFFWEKLIDIELLRSENLTIYIYWTSAYSTIIEEDTFSSFCPKNEEDTFSIFCPKDLTVYWCNCHVTLDNFLSKELESRGARKPNFWQQNLKEAQIECLRDFHAKWQLIHRKALDNGLLQLRKPINRWSIVPFTSWL